MLVSSVKEISRITINGKIVKKIALLIIILNIFIILK
jgi:hypothetical protein